jgi:hypothetical protein
MNPIHAGARRRPLDYKALNSAGFSPRSRRQDGGKLTHRFLFRSKAIPDTFPE